MFKQISRMFGSNDPDTPEEPDEEIDQAAPADAGAPPIDSDELDSEREVPSDDADEGPDVNELDVRIDELQDDLDSTDASLQQLRNSQEEMADSIDEMNDRVRQLVGVYDRIAAEENPFVDDPAEATPSNGDSPMAAAEGSQGGQVPAAGGHEGDGTHEQPATEGTDDDVVSFDDLWEEQEASAGQELPPEDDRPSTRESEQPAVEARSASTASAASQDEVLLETIPDGYAGEVLVMEWLATLMERSGPAGAFRAVDYYENVGWISPTVEQRLVDVIGGPALDVFVDPTQPREPTAEEHAVSHEYLRVMARLNQI
mgnify:CR=1 FL=1